MATDQSITKPLTAEIVRFLLHYDPATGVFTTLTTTHRGRWKAGRRIGWIMSHGYRALTILGHGHLEHRVAWLYMTGEWPKSEIDHRNLDRSDNRWANLREASHYQNTRNHPGHHKLGSGRLKGTTKHIDGRWRAQIMVSGRQIYLGIFATQELAHAAYQAASERLHGAFGRSES